MLLVLNMQKKQEHAKLLHANSCTHLHFGLSFIIFPANLSKIFVLLFCIMLKNLMWKLEPLRIDKPHLQGTEENKYYKRTCIEVTVGGR